MNNIGIVISGGISLGTYESGACASILESFYSGDISDIKGISGASAGAINAFMLAYALHKGLSPYTFKKIWCDYADINKLLKGSGKNIFTFKYMKRYFSEFLSINETCLYEFNSNKCLEKRCENYCERKKCKNARTLDTYAIIEMTSIEGYITEINNMNFKMHNDNFVIDFSKYNEYDKDYLIDIIFSSAAIPFVFSPFHIMKNVQHMKYRMSSDYVHKSIGMNYVDGGFTDNLPFHSLFSKCSGIEHMVLISPSPFNPDSVLEKLNKDHSYSKINSVITALLLSYNAISYQSLYHDVQSLEYYNNVIKGIKHMEMNGMISSKAAIEISSITETTDKSVAELHIIKSNDPDNMLSGEIMNHFGGFFRKDMREWDMINGYLDACRIMRCDTEGLFTLPSDNLGNVRMDMISMLPYILRIGGRILLMLMREISLILPHFKGK